MIRVCVSYPYSVFIDWPWRWGYLIVTDDDVAEVIFNHGTGEWEVRLLATF